MRTKEHKEDVEVHAPHHKGSDTPDIEAQAEAEMKRKGLKPADSLLDHAVFAPISLEDQKYIHASDPGAWKEIHTNIRERKAKDTERAREIDLKRQEEELKLLKVKRYDETKEKPDFMCVVNGCGEDKAPGQGYHCVAHCKSS